jgi:hypothetical protein
MLMIRSVVLLRVRGQHIEMTGIMDQAASFAIMPRKVFRE